EDSTMSGWSPDHSTGDDRNPRAAGHSHSPRWPRGAPRATQFTADRMDPEAGLKGRDTREWLHRRRIRWRVRSTEWAPGDDTLALGRMDANRIPERRTAIGAAIRR